jgi:hypothetical protein
VPLWLSFTIIKDRPMSLRWRQLLNTAQSLIFIGSIYGRYDRNVHMATPTWIWFCPVVITLFTCFWNRHATGAASCTFSQY